MLLLQKRKKFDKPQRDTNQKQNESTSSESEVNDRKRERGDSEVSKVTMKTK